MAYQALYRQWRPADFSSMVAQEAVIRTLRNQVVSHRIAHAYLFCGSRGTGKTSTAKIMSRAINCEHPVDGDPCCECATCKMLMSDESLDVMEIDAASNNGVDEMRNLRESVKYPPQHTHYKVYIIDEVHMLSASAFNALLKTLEEPPSYVVFILATTEPQKLPATILSRCQRFDFGRIPVTQIVGRLRQAADKAEANATDSALTMIARAAEGGMRDALSLLDMCLGYDQNIDDALVRRVLGTSDRSFLFRVAESLQNSDAGTLMQQIDELMRSGREPVVFARELSQHLRSLLLARCCSEDLTSLLDITEEDAQEYRGQADGFSDTRLTRMIDIFMSVQTELRYASSPRLALETAAIRACLRTAEVDTVSLNERISQLETELDTLRKKIASGQIQLKAEAAPAKETASAHAPKEAAKPVQQSQLTPTGRSVPDVWKEAMNILKKEATRVYSFLTQGRFAGCDGDIYKWETPQGQDFYLSLLNRDDNRSVIIDALTRSSGVPCRFEAISSASVMKAADKQDDDAFLQSVSGIFGAANVTVREQQK